MRTIFCASDLHIGYGNANYGKISTLFKKARREADVLYLLGDTFDLWRYPVDKINKDTMPMFEGIIQELKDLAQSIDVVIVPGNHDYNLEEYWTGYQEFGIEVTDQFVDNNILFTHGWQFDVEQRLGSFAYAWLIEIFPYIYQRYFKKLPHSTVPTRSAYIETKMSKRVHDEAREYAMKKGYDRIVIGHTHVPFMSPFLIDCGDFITNNTYVVFEGNNPTLRFL
jgi:UDP-2,3-diacylglucosamine pyrophosphatase LpxH